jgi:signal transduction histidine kinase
VTAGLLVVALDGTVRILNPTGRRLLHLSVEPAGADFHDLLRDLAPLVAVIDDCLTTHRPLVRRALQMPRPASVATHLGVTVSPLFDKAGELHGAICLFTDLTDVMDLEEQVRLKDSLARLGELAAGIAHEFRNGLATIHGYSRLVDIDGLPPAAQRYILAIRAETDSLNEIVTNFLNFARPAQLTVVRVDLRSLLERLAAETIDERQVVGDAVRVTGEFPTVEGDEVLLRQAFDNLIRNAFEACAAAGTPPRIVIEGQVDHGLSVARIAITDNGPGVDPATKDRLFRPFFTTKSSGTGLGLALVQKIVVTHNGRIAVSNASGGGAVFHVTLPCLPES